MCPVKSSFPDTSQATLFVAEAFARQPRRKEIFSYSCAVRRAGNARMSSMDLFKHKPRVFHSRPQIPVSISPLARTSQAADEAVSDYLVGAQVRVFVVICSVRTSAGAASGLTVRLDLDWLVLGATRAVESCHHEFSSMLTGRFGGHTQWSLRLPGPLIHRAGASRRSFQLIVLHASRYLSSACVPLEGIAQRRSPHSWVTSTLDCVNFVLRTSRVRLS